MADLRPVADSVARHTGFRDVKLGLVRDDAPAPVREEAVRRIREIVALQGGLTGKPVVVVPLLISRGRISLEKFPEDHILDPRPCGAAMWGRLRACPRAPRGAVVSPSPSADARRDVPPPTG